MTATKPKVERYRLVTASGRPIRLATKVTFPDGQVVKFMDRMSAREAIRQAQWQLEHHPEHFRDRRRRARRDESYPEIPKSMKPKKAAIERAIKALSQAEQLDSTERFKALKKIYAAADRLAYHARYKEGWDYPESNALENDLRHRAQAAEEQAQKNYENYLARESQRLREAARAAQPALGSYERELALTRIGVPYKDYLRDARRRKRAHRHRTAGAPTFKKQTQISRKIKKLVGEGYPPKQATAIAYRMAGVPTRKGKR
jgi:hypothetical protein